MVRCSRCGRMYPKKRLELGYDYCVHCSTEKAVVCMIEEQGQGDHTWTDIVIMKPEEYRSIVKAKTGKLDKITDDVSPDMSSTEEQAEQEMYSSSVLESVNERDKYMNELEKEFGNTDRLLDDLIQANQMLGFEEDDDDIVEDDDMSEFNLDED